MEFYARLCETASQFENQRKPPDGWEIVKNYSNIDVLTVRKGRKYVIALRGTDNKNKIKRKYADFLVDFFIFIGKPKFVSRLYMCENVIRNLNKYGYNDITVCGFSLGGWLTMNLCRDFPKIHGVAFNPGSSPINSDVYTNDNITVYTTNSITNIDPISITSILKDRVKIIYVKKKESESVHSLANFY